MSTVRACFVGVLVAFFVVVVAAGEAERASAQSTGGSFGGGDWGGGGGSDWGGGGGSDWGGSGSDWGGDWGGDDDDWSGGGGAGVPYPSSYGGVGGGGCCGGICLLAVIGILVVVVVLSQRRGGRFVGPGQGGAPRGGPAFGGYAGPDAIYVSQIQLGIDWRARAQLQQRLAELAATGDTRSPTGLAHLLAETVLALRRAEMSWLYFGYKDLGGAAPQRAQAAFLQLANDARARFRTELVRAHGGGVERRQADGATAHPHEGQGTVVVTIVLATRRPMMGVAVPDAAQIRHALADRGALLPEHLVALEVVWSPAAENDRMSTSELEQHYPELRLIDPNSIAGRIFCAYCSGPFPMELLNCPHCGAPAEASKDRRQPPR